MSFKVGDWVLAALHESDLRSNRYDVGIVVGVEGDKVECEILGDFAFGGGHNHIFPVYAVRKIRFLSGAKRKVFSSDGFMYVFRARRNRKSVTGRSLVIHAYKGGHLGGRIELSRFPVRA